MNANIQEHSTIGEHFIVNVPESCIHCFCNVHVKMYTVNIKKELLKK